jgi:hypothetical protein
MNAMGYDWRSGERSSLQALRDLLGHSSISITEKYAQLEDAVMHAAAAAISGRTVPIVAKPPVRSG